MAIHIDNTSLKALRKNFSGEILLPEEAGYDESRRLFNAMIDRHPGVIAQCAEVKDVVSAVNFGRQLGLEIAVRGGGHGVAGKASTEGGLVIDLRRMNAVSIDPEARTATVGGGATMSHLDRATQPHDLATTGGRVSTTGVGGYTLGGGDGWLARKFGLACDNLLAAELVTADGSIVHASEEENPELFWALHGGGGNFGVATSLTFRLHELKQVTALLLVWSPDKASEVLRAYRDYLEAAPDQVGGGALYITAPPEAFVPEHFVSKLTFAVLVVYAGPEAEAREVVAPLLALGHEAEMIAEMPYADLQCMLDDPPGYRNYWSAEYLETFPDEAIALFCERASDMIVPSPSQQVLIPQGGAVGNRPSDFPVPWRHAPWAVHPFGLWENSADDERGRQWTQRLRRDLSPWATGSVYLNFIGDEGKERIIAGFGRENYERLARIKTRYDPQNLFHLNQNIAPA
ncbi:FAD-binding oxidoreductase [Halomonas sp. TRM85114]|uniref:FAD-binding oxidoreductase n=1 Tax=Halomonas jincaotanensis TaxID=2810616 RepID=UPI001BD2BBB1|nr:FAD-binding oxidoreductase [Halomonas jincaotanensis]MBS9403515.1 FAD-binding oxidoreductase [Halomonas jincaotanensis]